MPLVKIHAQSPIIIKKCVSVSGADDNSDRTNMTMGFALYDRSGPTPEELRVLANIDALANTIALSMTQCNQIRSKVFPNARPEADAQSLADSMDLHVSRQSTTTRYCYTKIVPPEATTNEMFHTFFWTQDGKHIPLDVILGYRNFHAIPLVEVEDVFVSKAVRSIQLKLRECIVIPPPERINTRFSVCFPDKVCSASTADHVDVMPTALVVATNVEPQNGTEGILIADDVTHKRPREGNLVNEEPSPKKATTEVGSDHATTSVGDDNTQPISEEGSDEPK